MDFVYFLAAAAISYNPIMVAPQSHLDLNQYKNELSISEEEEDDQTIMPVLPSEAQASFKPEGLEEVRRLKQNVGQGPVLSTSIDASGEFKSNILLNLGFCKVWTVF